VTPPDPPSSDPQLERRLDKVRKLLALADSPNIHEAALAAARAQALIDEHRLQGLLAAEQVDPVADGRDDPLHTSRRLRRWKVSLAMALAGLNGVVAYTHKQGKFHHIVLVGTAADRAAVQVLWQALVHRIAWLSATHGEGRDKRWHDAFRIGAVQTISARLQRGQQSSRQALSTTALVTVDGRIAARQERVQAFVKERLRLRPGRAIRVDPQAYQRGRLAGADVDLPDG
jgi:hypothetical protein